MAILKKKCVRCGAGIGRAATFCPHCGAPQSGGKAQCGHCGRDVSAAATFCPYCGTSMDAARPPAMGDNRWRRSKDDFANHIVVDDVRGFFARDLIVEPGTQAILLADGANMGIVGPGKYTLDDLVERGEVFLRLRSAHRMEAILVDTADTELEFTIGGLYTQDPLAVSVTCAVAVQVDKPMRFFQTLMRSQRSFGKHQLREYLYAEVEDAAREWVGDYKVEALSSNLRIKQELEVAIQAHVEGTGVRNGLQVVRVRALDLVHPYEERVTGARAEAFIAAVAAQEQFAAERTRMDRERVARGLATEEEVAEKEDALTQRRALDAIYSQEELQVLIEETRKVEMHEKKAQVWDRMRKSVLSDKMAELRSEQELESFLREQDKDNLLSEKEWNELQQTIREEQDDHRTMRAHLLAKTQMERDYEQKQIDLLRRSDLNEAQLVFEQKYARRELEGKQELDQKRWEFDLDRREREAEFERQQRKVTEMDHRERELQDTVTRLDVQMRQAQTQAEIARLQREQDQADGELGLLLLEKMKEVKRRDQIERDLHQLEVERQRSEIALSTEAQRIEIQLKVERQQHEFELQRDKQTQDHEIERIRVLSQASSDVVISLSGPEQARIIVDLKETEALKGMSDAQVEAVMAARSPELARALAERWQAIEAGQATEAQMELYERMLAQQAESDKRVEDALRDSLSMQQKSAEMQQETGLEGMRIVQKTAEAFAQAQTGQQPPTIVVTPGAGGPVVMPVGGAAVTGASGAFAGRVQICSNCRAESLVGIKFCQNCGHEFFG